jgi:predicted transcriptional regulator
MNPALEDLQLKKTDNDVEKVRAVVRSDRQPTMRIIASELNLNHASVHQILTQATKHC